MMTAEMAHSSSIKPTRLHHSAHLIYVYSLCPPPFLIVILINIEIGWSVGHSQSNLGYESNRVYAGKLAERQHSLHEIDQDHASVNGIALPSRYTYLTCYGSFS